MKAIDRLLQNAQSGREIGVSRWFEVKQEDITDFGRATHDSEEMHDDPDWAAENSPYGRTIAYGFWTLSMLSAMIKDIGYYPELWSHYPEAHELNYGFDRVRLIAPVKVGSRIRLRANEKEVIDRGAGKVMFRTECLVEIEGGIRPALTAEWLFVLKFPAKEATDN